MSESNVKQPKKKLALVRENVKSLGVRSGVQAGDGDRAYSNGPGKVSTVAPSSVRMSDGNGLATPVLGGGGFFNFGR